MRCGCRHREEAEAAAAPPPACRGRRVVDERCAGASRCRAARRQRGTLVGRTHRRRRRRRRRGRRRRRRRRGQQQASYGHVSWPCSGRPTGAAWAAGRQGHRGARPPPHASLGGGCLTSQRNSLLFRSTRCRRPSASSSACTLIGARSMSSMEAQPSGRVQESSGRAASSARRSSFRSKSTSCVAECQCAQMPSAASWLGLMLAVAEPASYGRRLPSTVSGRAGHDRGEARCIVSARDHLRRWCFVDTDSGCAAASRSSGCSAVELAPALLEDDRR